LENHSNINNHIFPKGIPLPSGLFKLGQKKEKQVRCKMDDGMASAEISVICGSKPITLLNP